MTKVALISGCGANYFPMLREWIHSVRSFPQSKDMDICILNAGMTPEQIESIRPFVTSIKEAEWPCHVSPRKVKGKEFLKACVARPFIPDYFPGYDVYFWMDADTWVQNWKGIDLFIKGGLKKKIALTGQVDRAYPRQLRVKWLWRWPWKVRGFYFSNALRAYGFKTAKNLLPYHVLLAGAFCLHHDAPHWKRWQELVVKAMKKGKIFTAEQLSLGVLCYNEGYEFEILPAWTHWLCQFKPLWDEEKSKFIEPSLPHEEISILHLSGWDEMRVNRASGTDFKTLQGNEVFLSYRYPYLDGEDGKEISYAPVHEPFGLAYNQKIIRL